jgi:hypothetical protein
MRYRKGIFELGPINTMLEKGVPDYKKCYGRL